MRMPPPLSRFSAVAAVLLASLAASGTAAAALSVVPKDPLWGREWGLKRVGAPHAWAITRGNPRVVVAVLDSGVDLTHPDLRGGLVPGHDFVGGDDIPADDNGHGTAVAGVIAARANNGIGISGICPRCAVMPLKVTTAAGVASDSTVAAGITWAVDHGARVLSLSLGAGSRSATIDGAVQYAVRNGAVVVSSAGNSGSRAPFYPAANEGVLSVTSIDVADRLYPWANFGPWVDLSAPGCAFTTTRGGRYGSFCGTSASAPVVAGIAGLVIAAAPDANAADVEAAIGATAHRLGDVAPGRVNAAAAVRSLGRCSEPVPWNTPREGVRVACS